MTPKPDPSDGPTRPSAPTGRTEPRKELSREIVAAWLAADDGDLEGCWEHAGRAADLYEEIAKQRAEEAERALAQARDAIAAVRRAQALAEAAKRESVASFARRITGEPFPARLLADDVIAALTIEQPKETP